MERVTGIGGIFFRSTDPEALAAWYEQHLGVLRTPTSYDAEVWLQEAGPTVFGPMPADSPMLPASAQLMLNFRVNDLDAMVRQLQEAGVAVDVDPERYPNGRFAYLADPDGNPIQLWQPEQTDAERVREHD